MNNRFIRNVMTTALAFIIGLTSIPVYAETDSTASTDYQNVTEAGEYTATVYATKASTYTISIPKTIILDGQTGIGEYQISLNGDIDSNVTISVTPDASFTMSEQSGSEIEATVVQDKTEWTQSDSSVNANGTITAELSAGSWTGSFKFNVAISEASLAPGLYETGTTNMTKSWQELLDEGILVVTDGVLDHGGVTTYATTNPGFENPINDYLVGDLIIDKTVDEIASLAFRKCKNLTGVTIPDSVTTIGDEAFEECYGLANVTISDSVSSIGWMAFAYCTSLTNVTIPDTVTSIGDGAFYNVPNVNYNGIATGRPWGALAINGRSVISFTIDSTSYKAEEGMTWGEWVDSEYDTDGYEMPVESIYNFVLDVYIIDSAKGTGYNGCVRGSDVIKPNYEYITWNENSKEIYFTIDGISYRAERGMTWEDWVNSEYNTDGYYIAKVYVMTSSDLYVIYAFEDPFTSSEIIEEQHNYILTDMLPVE